MCNKRATNFSENTDESGKKKRKKFVHFQEHITGPNHMEIYKKFNNKI